VKPWIEKAVKGSYDKKKIAEILQQRVNTLAEIPEMIDFFDTMPDYDLELYKNKKMKTDEAISLKALKAVRETLAGVTEWTQPVLHDTLMELPAKMEMKNGQILFPLRLAITGKQFTPGGGIEIADILGKDETLRRIDAAIARLS
ncbi:MAG: glutamate--tRNA ligase, partial [Solobacterium sp.]|nr:glutamate--tRNA ligase [Solobacterium sp.]